MDRVTLISPPSHPIYEDGDSCSHPLSAAIHLYADSPLLSLHIALVRTISLSPTQNKKLWFIPSKPNGPPKQFTDEVLSLNLATTPISAEIGPDGVLSRYEFTLSIPSDIPETINTPESIISYALIASATTSSQTLTDCQPLHLSRLKIHDPWEDINHFRSFPNSPIKAQYAVHPQLSEDKKRFSGEVVLRNIARPGPRHSELTRIVVETLRWRVDEIEQWKTPEDDTRVRRVAKGCRKWRRGLSVSDFKETDITIPYEINIDHALNDFHAEDQSTPTLSIRHQLTVEIITGKETIDQSTGYLVARKRATQKFGATIPLPIHEYAPSEAIVKQFEPSFWMPPGYEQISIPPPEYQE
ncbi:hypothetical protein ASPWEDRAFT_294805 [Aspergillus wentii DTO 134E9]|uniref:LDB19 N-terminal domain-containing protein n=1 Tax=Aspergillus wentii DTO 134E9 TaxID=1073089 RepID=A0A1L9R454_ASPWE|nr:uncharacterized protein ASPWEDRAFT_294805 [Aspergillus wentii DTO 134E9]KAI9926985.1 hypothetical protein MW887_003366 [Aspergillus wentii]OJJ29698.1 hypothetical protein ASPWEDRAFT_294805 [Aspergillus wentii DTO 134E9]